MCFSPPGLQNISCNYRFFPEKWVNFFFNTDNAKDLENVSIRDLDLYISIDPPSHSESCMGLSAIVYSGDSSPGEHLVGGTVFVVGQAEVGVMESQMIELSTLVVRFTLKVLEQLVTLDRPAKNIRVIPIVEYVYYIPCVYSAHFCVHFWSGYIFILDTFFFWVHFYCGGSIYLLFF